MNNLDQINEQLNNNIYDENICKLLILLKENILSKVKNMEEAIRNSRDFHIFSAMIFSFLSIFLFLMVNGTITAYIILVVFICLSNYLKYNKETYFDREVLKSLKPEEISAELENLEICLSQIKNKNKELETLKRNLSKSKNNFVKNVDLELPRLNQPKPKRKALELN